MSRIFLAVALALGSAPVQAQPAANATSISPSVDSAEQRQSLRSFLGCVARSRPEWARQTLALPYLSDAQAGSAAEALSGKDTCLKGDDAALTIRTSSIVANLAEMSLRPHIERADPNRLATVLNMLTPLNASEDFALCLAARDPLSAQTLALSEFGSAEETQAAQRVARHVTECVREGERLTIDLQALRALMSIALYRATKTMLASR